jgi:hypothetical protein
VTHVLVRHAVLYTQTVPAAAFSGSRSAPALMDWLRHYETQWTCDNGP